MKSTYSRRYRRSAAPTREAAGAKKDNQHEQPFFSPASSQSFFKPNTAIQRKYEKCEAGDTNLNRMTDKEEQQVQKMEEKKEEKPIQKMEELKEEEKPVQKMEELKEEEKPVQKMEELKEEEKPVQKMEQKEEEKPIQKTEEEKLDKKGTVRNGRIADQTSSYIHSLDGKGSTLPDETQQFFKQRMGYDFSHVRIHTDTAAVQSAKKLHAKAYATGNHIVFNTGQYDTGSAEGRKLLAHELTHVAQQKGNGPEVLINARQMHINKKEKSSQLT